MSADFVRIETCCTHLGSSITESPVSVAAKGLAAPSRGLSLRFPRFIRVREDKNIETASTPAFLLGLWAAQQGRAAIPGNDDGDLVDIHSDHSDLDYLSEEDEDL